MHKAPKHADIDAKRDTMKHTKERTNYIYRVPMGSACVYRREAGSMVSLKLRSVRRTRKRFLDNESLEFI